jgi:hydroxymethylpyrimidine/phosphomethylpyrimidine kinase
MLASAEMVSVLADAIKRHSVTTTVVDPVCFDCDSAVRIEPLLSYLGR